MIQPKCRKCGVSLTDVNWWPSCRKGNARICGSCSIAKLHEWQKNNWKHFLETRRVACNRWQNSHRADIRRVREDLKRKAFDAYGRVCACCGESRIEFLTLHHPNGDGAEHRHQIFGNRRQAGRDFYQWLKNNNYPRMDLQVFCWNCNCAISNYGFCPHGMNHQKGLHKALETKDKEA